ncbi:hypothetical protein IAQ61_002184 [Plenodomus lingam]|uniref:uncharacterized protein n=1 Tax=Leptosphaeria maculans TaxID=5022 RepID=UPI003328A7AF|nr:hypothetical protein IAQ61_002184 [Plenodomus lingam]
MIESLRDLKHEKSGSYEHLALERTASQILHHMEDKDSEDSLESTRTRVLSNARAIYGANRCLDVISFAPTSSRRIGAAIIEHNPTSRSYIHCSSAKEKSRLAALEHLLVITEDLLQRLIDAEGITSSGWLPATAQSQHAVTYSIASAAGSAMNESVAGSVPASRRSSVAPQDHVNSHDCSPGYSGHPLQKTLLIRGNSDTTFHGLSPQQPPLQGLPRTASDFIKQPVPVPVDDTVSETLSLSPTKALCTDRVTTWFRSPFASPQK